MNKKKKTLLVLKIVWTVLVGIIMIFSGEYIGLVCLTGLIGIHFFNIAMEKNDKEKEDDFDKG